MQNWTHFSNPWANQPGGAAAFARFANPTATQAYAVVMSDGSVLALAPSFEAAVSDAERSTPNVAVDGLQLMLEPNPATLPMATSEMSWRNVHNLRIGPAWRSMSLEEAHARLAPIMPQTKGGKPVKKYLTPEGMSESLLGQNYKTAKDDPRQPSDVQGLSLLPYWSWNDLVADKIPGRKRVNTCVGSSAACRQACLVYSGRNEADKYNVLVKTARMNALLREPEAFGRMLYENCRRHQGNPKRRHFVPYVRLNVFSDIPWELVFPDLYAALPDLRFYDYTKVARRRVPANYDITFSYSGVNQNAMVGELASGRRAAVVFLVRRYDKKTDTSYMPPFLEVGSVKFPVVDGDISDVRPLDPAPSIVGLAYKAPKPASASAAMGLKRSTAKADSTNTSFVVKVERMGDALVAAVVPRDQPGVVKANNDDTLPASDRVLV